MAVRVRLRLSVAGREDLESVAVLNTGFEMPEPHLLLPASCARRLFPDFPQGASRQALETAGGETPDFFLIADKVEARVRAPDREGQSFEVKILVSEKEREVLVSDTAISALEIRIEDPGPGTWRFADESRIRESEPSQRW